MNNKLLLSVTGIWLLVTGIAHAAVFERDLIPGSSDGLLTFDDVNNREWLDLTESLLDQFNGSNIIERYDDALAELVSGGLFDGFQAAAAADVVGLAESAGIETTSLGFSTNAAATGQLIDLLGPTLGSPVNDGALASNAIGLVSDITVGGGRLQAHLIYRDPAGSTSEFAGLSLLLASDTARVNTTGMMLFRQIPEPGTAVLMIITSFLYLLQFTRQRIHQI